MKNIKKYITNISFVLVATLTLSLIAVQLEVEGFNSKVYAATVDIPKGYKLQSKTNTLELYCNTDDGNIVVKDTRNDYIWKSVVDESMYEVSKLNKKWQAYLQSPLVLNYVDMQKRDAAPLKTYSFTDAATPTVEKIEDGVAVTYLFEVQGISITIEYKLEDDNFIATIPAEKIKEQMPVERENPDKTIDIVNYGVISVEVLPFFGAANDDIDGYLLYPDGPGGLTLYSEVDNRPADVKMATWKMYSDNLVEIGGSSRYTASMPIYGMKNNDNAFLAAMTVGAEQSGITAYPSGYVVNLNHMNFDMFYRYHYDIKMSSVSVNGVNTGKEVSRAEENLIKIDKEIRFFMLAEEEANYSVMANKYRNYLLENNLIKDTIKDDDKIPLSLNIFMGITQQQMIFEKFIKMTTFDNVVEILDDLKSNNINNINMVLRGWAKGGYYKNPINWPPARQLGGTKGLKSLDAYVSENDSVNLFLENDFVYANKDNGTFSARNDVVLDGGRVPVTNYNNKWYLLNPIASALRNSKLLNTLSKYTSLSVAYEVLGEKIYQDYHKVNPSSRGETVETWKSMLKASEDANKKVAVEGANQYVFGSSDFIYDIPIDTYGYFITDKEVPFLQMVLSGLVPYSATAGNLSPSLQQERLKWIEYGCVPHFELTYEDSLKLKSTDYNSLYTSKYSLWKENVIDTYNEFTQNLSDVYSYQMVSHEEIRDNVIKVGYSNGFSIYINYNETRSKIGDLIIEGKEYIVVDKGGDIR